MSRSCTPPSGAINLDMWRSFLNMETCYESVEELCGDAIDGGLAQFLVDFCLKLRLNPQTRRQKSLNQFKEEWEDPGWKHRLRWWMPTISTLCGIPPKLSHSDSGQASLPHDTSRVSKRVRI